MLKIDFPAFLQKLGAGNGGGADGGVVAVQNRQDLVKDHLIAGLLGQLLDKQGVALSI